MFCMTSIWAARFVCDCQCQKKKVSSNLLSQCCSLIEVFYYFATSLSSWFPPYCSNWTPFQLTSQRCCGFITTLPEDTSVFGHAINQQQTRSRCSAVCLMQLRTPGKEQPPQTEACVTIFRCFHPRWEQNVNAQRLFEVWGYSRWIIYGYTAVVLNPVKSTKEPSL